MTLILLNNDMFQEFPKIDSKTINLVIADLPYGQTDCKWDNEIDIVSLWIHLKRIGTDNCCYVFFCNTKFGYKLIQSNEKWFRYDLVWDKEIATGFMNARKQPMRQHEMIYIFYNKLPVYNIQGNHTFKSNRTNKKYLQSGIYDNSNVTIQTTGAQYDPKLPTSILTYKKNNYRKKAFHPTEKPVELFEWLIRYYTNKEDTVLDICFGSGNSAIATKNLGRFYIGIEIDNNYFNSLQERI